MRLGDGIRAIELDVTLTDNPAAKADYDRAVDAYDRANSHHRKGDEPAADRALDEGLAAIGSAQERLAGRKRSRVVTGAAPGTASTARSVRASADAASS